MDANAISGEIVYLDVPTPTVESAAQAVGTHPSQIVKSLLFTIDQTNILAITNGTGLIDRRCIASHFGVGRKRVKLAPPEVVLFITGYPVGTVPPFGHRTPIQILIDPLVFERDEVYAGGGSHNALVKIHPNDILRVTQAEIIDLHNPPEPS